MFQQREKKLNANNLKLVRADYRHTEKKIFLFRKLLL